MWMSYSTLKENNAEDFCLKVYILSLLNDNIALMHITVDMISCTIIFLSGKI